MVIGKVEAVFDISKQGQRCSDGVIIRASPSGGIGKYITTVIAPYTTKQYIVTGVYQEVPQPCGPPKYSYSLDLYPFPDTYKDFHTLFTQGKMHRETL